MSKCCSHSPSRELVVSVHRCFGERFSELEEVRGEATTQGEPQERAAPRRGLMECLPDSFDAGFRDPVSEKSRGKERAGNEVVPRRGEADPEPDQPAHLLG